MNRISKLSLAVLIALTPFAVYAQEKNPSQTTAPTSTPAAPVKPQAQTLPIQDVQEFTNAIKQIKKYYVQDIDDKTLFQNAIRGMLAGLDPHSTYLDSKEYADLRSQTDGKFAGLGLEVSMEDGYLTVVSPLDDTPAFKAGIKPGDLILKINSEPVDGMSLQEAVNKMRGPADSPITLTLFRQSEQKPMVLNLKREEIHVHSVTGKLLEQGYGYIRISQFQTPTAEELNKEMATLIKENKNQNLKGLVLDLRNNPGGLLDSAIEVSDAFLDTGTGNNLIVFTKGRMQGSRLEAHVTPGDLLKGAPLIVLINSGSASGSEIVAGALQDHKRAIIMGTATFGKGSVQTVLPLDENSGIKLTTALYYTPSGRTIQAKGIKPDVQVEQLSVKDNQNKTLLEVASIKEADLNRHLANTQKDAAAPKAEKAPKTSLAQSDYQVSEALNLLKGLNIAGTASSVKLAQQ